MEEKESFTIKDKRRFREGEEGFQEPVTEPHPEKSESETKPRKETTTPSAEINFSSFIFSLGRSAFIHLGEEPDPASGTQQISLPMAKETIEIISLLEEKTKGNLTQEEDQLLKNILYALRMKYVALASKRP